MLLNTIADYLQGLGLGTEGADLFIGLMPQDVTNGLLLRSPLGGIPIDYEMPNYFRHISFQVIVRCTYYADGDAKARQVMNALTLNDSTLLPGLKVNYMRPRHEPVSYPLSAGNNLEFSVNFDANYVIVQ